MRALFLSFMLSLAICFDSFALDLCAICPGGMLAEDVPGAVADYVADWMTYDSHMERGSRQYEFNIALNEGRGVCVGYSLLFCDILRHIPIDEYGVVNYHTLSPLYYCCTVICNDFHAWSAVLSKDGWLWYDITFYDNSEFDRLPEYAPMSSKEMHDGWHGAPRIY